jgi:hypothetical protein
MNQHASFKTNTPLMIRCSGLAAYLKPLTSLTTGFQWHVLWNLARAWKEGR